MNRLLLEYCRINYTHIPHKQIIDNILLRDAFIHTELGCQLIQSHKELLNDSLEQINDDLFTVIIILTHSSTAQFEQPQTGMDLINLAIHHLHRTFSCLDQFLSRIGWFAAQNTHGKPFAQGAFSSSPDPSSFQGQPQNRESLGSTLNRALTGITPKTNWFKMCRQPHFALCLTTTKLNCSVSSSNVSSQRIVLKDAGLYQNHDVPKCKQF